MSRVLVVGGGILGMSLARDLVAQGHDLTVFDSGNAPGGLASPETIGGYEWDRFYHVILQSDRHLMALLDELGLADSMRWGRTRTGFYAEGRLHSLSSTLDFVRFPLLGVIGKARLAATILRAARMNDLEYLESVPASEWLSRWSGRAVFERLWLPLLRSKLGEHWRDASAAFIWAIIRRMYGARQSGRKTEMFGYVDGGYRRILEALVASMARQRIQIRSGADVKEVRRTPWGVALELASGERCEADAVVLTVPCGRIARICPELSDGERERLRRVIYLGVACGTMLLRKPLADYYVTNITDPGLPFTGVIEMTALVDRGRFGGNSLVYLPRYLAREDPAWDQSDAEFREGFVAGLRQMYPRFEAADLVDFRLSRAKEVLAVSTLRYSRECLPPIATSIPGVFIANSAQIAAGTLNVNETLGVAHAASAALGPLLAADRGLRMAA
jgi:protoporphyrinogen oxidase